MMILNRATNRKIDVVIPYHGKDSKIIELCIQGCINNIENLGKIYIITSNTDLELHNIKLINEDKIFKDGLSKRYIELRWLVEYAVLAHRTGWLFQQFIKMGCSYAIPDLTDYYLVVDSDVVFLKKIDFFDNDIMLLTKTKEFHLPYFECYQKLLGESPNRQSSFVAHHMLISKVLMLELLDEIEKKFKKKWYDAILDNMDYKQASPFSEYETYGHYLQNHHADKFTTREPAWAQKLNFLCALAILFNRIDYFVFHNYKKTSKNKMFKLINAIVASKVYQEVRRTEK